MPDPAGAEIRLPALCIDFVYEWLVDIHQEVVIPRDALRVYPYSVQTWDA